MNQLGTPQQRRTALDDPSGSVSGGGVPGWLAFLVPALVLGAFAAYAFLAPATYRATTLIALEPTPGTTLDLGDPSVAASRLRAAALEPEAILAAAREFGLGDTPTATAETKRRIETMLEVLPSAPRTFDIRLLDSEAERAQRLCNLLARAAAARASQALGGVPPGSTNTGARAKSEQALRDFLAAHPELAPPVVAPAESAKVKDSVETELAKLRAERDQLNARVIRIEEAAAASDNPYGDAPREPGDPQVLRRRLDEINMLLRRATERKPTTAKVSPEVEREHQRLREAVAQASAESPSTVVAARFTVRLSEAGLPSSPVQPDRWFFLLIGTAVALVLAIVLLALSALSRRRRTPVTESYATDPYWVSGSDRPPGAGSDRPPGAGSDRPPGAGSDRPPSAGSDRPPGAGSDRPFATGSDFPSRSPTDPTGLGPQPPAAAPALSATPVISVSPAAGPTPSLPGQTVAAPPTPRISAAPTAAVAPARIQSVNAAAPALTAPAPAPNPRAPVPNAPAPVPNAPAPVPNAPAPVPNAPAPVPNAPAPVPGAPAPVPNPPAPPANAPTQTPQFGRSTTLSGFAIVPAPMRTPAPSAPPAPEPPPVPPAPTAANHPPRAPVSPTVPPPPPDPAQHSSEPVRGAGLSSNRTATGPSHRAEVIEAEGNVAHGRKTSARTTQMLGSPIPPVIREPRTERKVIESPSQFSRESVRPATQAPGRADSHPSSPPKPRPSGYSYVSTPPPEARHPRHSSTPQWEGGKSYLSTPVPDAPADPYADPSASPNTIVAHRLHSSWTLDPRIEAESRRSTADQLFPLAVERCFVLGVTAVPDARGQKSRVAVEIALALAEARHPRVLLLEGDFQWPTLHTLLNIEMPRAAGVSQQVRNHASGRASQWSVVELGRSLQVMAEGVMRSPGLMLSNMFEDSLRYFRRHYDFIVIDGPLASSEVDCRAFDSLIDGIVIVSSSTSSDWLAESHALFPKKRFSSVLTV